MLFKKKKIDAKPKNERIYIKHAQQAAIKSNPMLAFKEWFDNLWAEDANKVVIETHLDFSQKSGNRIPVLRRIVRDNGNGLHPNNFAEAFTAYGSEDGDDAHEHGIGGISAIFGAGNFEYIKTRPKGHKYAYNITIEEGDFVFTKEKAQDDWHGFELCHSGGWVDCGSKEKGLWENISAHLLPFGYGGLKVTPHYFDETGKRVWTAEHSELKPISIGGTHLPKQQYEYDDDTTIEIYAIVLDKDYGALKINGKGSRTYVSQNGIPVTWDRKQTNEITKMFTFDSNHPTWNKVIYVVNFVKGSCSTLPIKCQLNPADPKFEFLQSSLLKYMTDNDSQNRKIIQDNIKNGYSEAEIQAKIKSNFETFGYSDIEEYKPTSEKGGIMDYRGKTPNGEDFVGELKKKKIDYSAVMQLAGYLYTEQIKIGKLIAFEITTNAQATIDRINSRGDYDLEFINLAGLID